MKLDPTFAIESVTGGLYGENHDSRSAARRLNIAEQTLANWRSQRKGPPYIKIGSKIIYKESDLTAFEERNRINPEAT